MRASAPIFALSALSALASAQQQVPLFDQVKGWLAKATESLSSVVAPATEPISGSVPDPVASTAAKVADLKVESLGMANYQELLKLGEASTPRESETWMVLVTGGNKTCSGLCDRVEKAFNESVPLIAASSHPPSLALLNCEIESVFCHAWAVNPPSLLHLQFPQPLDDQSTPANAFRSFPLNRTTITAPEIAAFHLQDKYAEREPYEGFFHPFDGPLAQYGLLIPLGYIVWAFSQIPSWAFMLIISFLSRTFMSRKPAPPAAGTGRAAQAPGAAAAAAAK